MDIDVEAGELIPVLQERIGALIIENTALRVAYQKAMLRTEEGQEETD